MMDRGTKDTIVIAELKGKLEGDLKVARTENEAMKKLIDAGLAQLREDAVKRETESARRETRLIPAMAGMIAIAINHPQAVVRIVRQRGLVGCPR